MTNPEGKTLRMVAGWLAGIVAIVLGELVLRGGAWIVVSIVDLKERVTALEVYSPAPKHSVLNTKKDAFHAAFGFEVPSLFERTENEKDSGHPN